MLSPSKLDSLLIEMRDLSVDAKMLCETWHDVDSASIRRLRDVVFGVIELARPRSRRSPALTSR